MPPSAPREIAKSGKAAATSNSVSAPRQNEVVINGRATRIRSIVVSDIFLDVATEVIDTEHAATCGEYAYRSRR